MAREKLVDRVLDTPVNVLSLIHAHVYFPCYSNGLKEVAGTSAAPGPSRTPPGSRAWSGGRAGRRPGTRRGRRSC